MTKSDAEAIKWFKVSADQGNKNGQYYLARMLMDGRGGAKDPGKALTFLELAAAKTVTAMPNSCSVKSIAAMTADRRTMARR